MNRKRLIWAGVILVVIVLAVYAYSGAQMVNTVKVEKGSISVRINETGYVQARSDFELQAVQAGYIKSLDVSIGDEVQAGQILLKLANPDLEISRTTAATQLAQAQAQLTAARQSLANFRIDLETSTKELKRTRQLYEAGAATEAEMEQAESAVQSLQETIDHQQEYIADLTEQASLSQQAVAQIDRKSEQLNIISPVAGTVLDLPLKQGAYVNYGTPVAQIGTPERLEVQADILGDQMADIKVGQKVFISSAVLGDKVLTGKVQTIRPRAFTKVSALGVEQRRVPVIINLDSISKLKPGYEVQISIETASRSGILTVPREAVQGTAGNEKVMLLVNNRIKHQDIKTGLRNGDDIEIKSGLKPGDVIIQDASEDIADDTRVKTN
ncbi:MAG: efflux RND transporter periplasmic adaptor subunit [Deltaproteobacteria bacterium]